MQNTLNQSSWFVIVLSLVIDMTTHERAFPSYNVIIGVFAWYCGQSVNMVALDSKESRFEVPDTKRLLNTLSCFSTVALVSILVDVIFCFIWGGEIIDGDVRSIKFAFAMFILNMVPKAVASL